MVVQRLHQNDRDSECRHSRPGTPPRFRITPIKQPVNLMPDSLSVICCTSNETTFSSAQELRADALGAEHLLFCTTEAINDGAYRDGLYHGADRSQCRSSLCYNHGEANAIARVGLVHISYYHV
jgi:hypothetical protein